MFCSGPNAMGPDEARALISFIADNFDKNKDGKIDYPGNIPQNYQYLK